MASKKLQMTRPTLDENIFVAHLWNLSLLIELQGIEATLSLDRPLLSRSWRHCVLSRDFSIYGNAGNVRKENIRKFSTVPDVFWRRQFPFIIATLWGTVVTQQLHGLTSQSRSLQTPPP
jgi:hypothetical protein